MTTEQLNLFGDVDEPKKPVEVPRPPSVKKRGGAFLPGVVPEDAYPGIDNYETLLTELKNCSRCSLRSGCRQVVPGDGKIASRILFIGEGPGADEDEQGIPFVGRAGKLLNQILKAAEFDRNEVFIGNVVKCRPPGNRLPNPDEVKECRKWLEAQIRLINPQIIVCLGALACQTVIDPRARIGETRGKWFTRNNVRIMATYHPAALLRNESYKRPVWEDFKLIRDEYKKL